MGVNDDRHRHLQTCGVLLLAATHLDQSDKVQVMNGMPCAFAAQLHSMNFPNRRLLCRDEELDSHSGHGQFVELDSLDTEKALLLTDDDNGEDDDPL